MINYPNVVIKKKESPPKDVVGIDDSKLFKLTVFEPFIKKRLRGNLKGRSYYLDSTVDWVVVKDNKGIVVLVPVKK